MSGPEPIDDHATSTRQVYDHSASRFVDAVGTEVNPRFEAPLDRAVLGAFAEQLLGRADADKARVLDAGCGPGRIASYLAKLGLDASGVDISPQMIEAARLAHPELGFDVGPLVDLPVPSETMTGVVYWYSIIATPLHELPLVWAELDRVLFEHGMVLVAFQTGANERDVRTDAYGSTEMLTLYRHSIDDVMASLETAGFAVQAEVRRQPEFEHEKTPQGFIVAQRQRVT